MPTTESQPRSVLVSMAMAWARPSVIVECLHSQSGNKQSETDSLDLGPSLALFRGQRLGKEQPPSEIVGGCHSVGKWSVSRVLSDCLTIRTIISLRAQSPMPSSSLPAVS